MTKIILVVLIICPFSSYGQSYTNQSNNLPDHGAGGASMDVQAADLDGDGDLDIVLANEFQPNTILINDGQGIFSNGTLNNLPQEKHDSEDVVIEDFNGDGFLDLIFCSEDDIVLGWQDVHEYYLGNGEGGFESSSFQFTDTEANAIMSSDVNGDGHMDLLFGNNGMNSLLLNDGHGIFEEVIDKLPLIEKTTQDVAFADIDNDGDLDIFEANENGNILLTNNGNGIFTDESESHLPGGLNIETRKVSLGDVDGDSDLDIFLSNVEFISGKTRQNRLFINDGNGKFSDKTDTNLPTDNDHTIDAIFEDIDQDGDLDLILCNIGGSPIKTYVNDGLGVYTDNTLEVFGQLYYRDALGVIAEDFNGDGLNDLYICDRRNPAINNKDLLLIKEKR